MRNWIVIEGDNGTGKDTQALELKKRGWNILNESQAVKDIAAAARSKQGEEQFESFLEYNLLCARRAEEMSGKIISIRYWPSTLAAGYADGIHTFEEFLVKFDECLLSYSMPDVFVYFVCNHEERKKRIDIRLKDHAHLEGCDDTSLDRSERHMKSMREIGDRLDNWYAVETSDLSVDEISLRVADILSGHYGVIDEY